ncbi:MAG: DNA translocase FtsK 4TM domain-containing protein [Planctomycetia bacterium]|nr:DNA translocase FtsK 4TM domain-containing protein [Planctomycetia bacterium]
MLQETYDRICRIVLSLLMVGLFCFFTLSLISFQPSDPPSTLVWPNSHQVQNYMGGMGAGFAQWMYTIFGLGVWYLLVGAAYHTTRFLAGCHARYPYLRFAGWCFSVLGVCGFVQVAFPEAFPDILIGSGGFVGATMSGFFAPTGTIFSLLGMIAITLFGWVLYSDYAIPRLARMVVRQFPRKNVRTFLPWLQTVFRARSGWNRALLREKEEPALSSSHTMATPAETEPLLLKKGGKTLLPTEEDSAEHSPVTPLEANPVVSKPKKPELNETGISIHPPQTVAKGDENAIQETFPEKEAEYVFPSLELLEPPEDFDYSEFETEASNRARHLEEIVQEFGFRIRVREIQLGPVITQYQVELESGLRVAKIASLADDLAVKLGVSNVRIVFPLLGKKNLVGIEIPNVKKQWVRLREVMEELAGTYTKKGIPIFLGKDVAGKSLMTDLTELPHLLIAGRTGTGKSVCLNSIITSILMTRSPREVRMLMIDPKMVELSQYKTIPHLMHPVVTDMKKAEAILAWAVEKMEDRYQWLARAGVRHVNTYNKLSTEERHRRIHPLAGETVPENMPYIVIVADEMADLMMTAPKEVESHIIRLAQKSRAVGIHLILATQKPIVSVITSLIKSNLPARIAFQVSSKTDSRVVLDENGADRLLGHGDMLFLLPGTSTLVRAQGTFLSDDEINRVVSAISTEKPQFDDEIEKHVYGNAANSDLETLAQKDELYIAAIDIIVREKRGSISLLQRMLGIGYGRAARLIDYMEEDGIVGPFCGYTKPREVLLSIEDWEAKQASGPGTVPPILPPSEPVSPLPETLDEEDEEDLEHWDEDPDDDLEKEPWDEAFSEDDEPDESLDTDEMPEDEEDDDALIEKYLRQPRKEEKKRQKKDRRRRPPNIEKIRMSDQQETDEILRRIEPNQPSPFLEDGKYREIQ